MYRWRQDSRIREKFSFFLYLVFWNRFFDLSANIDETELHNLTKYGKYFEFVKLKANLARFYSSQMVKDKALVSWMKMTLDRWFQRQQNC